MRNAIYCLGLCHILVEEETLLKGKIVMQRKKGNYIWERKMLPLLWIYY